MTPSFSVWLTGWCHSPRQEVQGGKEDDDVTHLWDISWGYPRGG